MSPIKIALIGVGKIARDQHIPAILADPAFELVATVSRHGGLDGYPNHGSVEELVAAGYGLDAVSLCTPPAGRHTLAHTAIRAGLHVMLEKPPATTLGEAKDIVDLAEAEGVTLFASWHSRAAAAVEPARAWLVGRRVHSVQIDWLENIREWHPGQEWILGAGGFGVFDPGINALSILTRIFPYKVRIDGSILEIPSNRVGPIAAALSGRCGDAYFAARFDFRKEGAQQWSITIDSDDGQIGLLDGGSRLLIGDRLVDVEPVAEYPSLYRHYAELIESGKSDADLEPLRIVADAFMQASPVECAPFNF